MADERKYSIVGKVEIGTDEYRDLIEAKSEAEKEASDYRSRYWAEQSKSKELSEKATKYQFSASEYAKFIEEQNLSEQFKLWKISKEDEYTYENVFNPGK